ncbi:unnamed protein product [Cylindrotheca closterium]|uniref:Uncharacterized protein n=1 Tax=Cylindrotheca closterium TaxID=2856 RepID=A0AAD2G413_9STRA|nr:unnamed protein product [Cylindrotheca closterium]
MRLNEQTNRANSNIVNTLLGEESGYRGSKSSLDYKEKDSGVLTTAKTDKKKKDPKNQSNQEQQKQKQRQFPTRARERTGIPPRRYDLSDLAKMDEYDLINALREDPEFAAAVSEYSAQLEEKEKAEKAAQAQRKDRRSKPSSPPVAARRKARLENSSSKPTAAPTARHPDHVRNLMDSGVPVTQWIVLFILVGAGLYFLMGPELKEGLKYIMKQTGKTKKTSYEGNKNKTNNKSKVKSRQSNKGKKKVDAPRKAYMAKKSPAITESKPKPVKQEAPTPVTQQQTVEETSSQPSPAAKKGKSKKNKSKRKQETKAEESLDQVSVDDGSTHNSDVVETPTLLRAGVSIPLVHMEPDADAGGWETVGRSRKPVVKSPPATTVITEESPKASSQKPVVPEAPKAKSQKVEKTQTVAQQIQVDEAKMTSQNVDIQEEIEAAKAASKDLESTNDGWETVTKSRKPKESTPAAKESSDRPSSPAPDTKSSKLAEEVAKAEDKKKQEAQAPGDKNVKKKAASKNKKQQKSTSQPAKSNNANATDGDAALALKLQLEEEKLVNPEVSGQVEDDAWEEVKKSKSKKGTKATTS